MANDLGLLAPHAATCCVGGTHCDLDLPESTTTVATATNRQLERSAAVRVTPVRDTVGIAAVAGAVGIAVYRFARTIRHGVGGRRADGIRDWVAGRKPKSTLEALVVVQRVDQSFGNLDQPG
jgi:hypothetical protein